MWTSVESSFDEPPMLDLPWEVSATDNLSHGATSLYFSAFPPSCFDNARITVLIFERRLFTQKNWLKRPLKRYQGWYWHYCFYYYDDLFILFSLFLKWLCPHSNIRFEFDEIKIIICVNKYWSFSNATAADRPAGGYLWCRSTSRLLERCAQIAGDAPKGYWSMMIIHSKLVCLTSRRKFRLKGAMWNHVNCKFFFFFS